jgi:subtilase family protein
VETSTRRSHRRRALFFALAAFSLAAVLTPGAVARSTQDRVADRFTQTFPLTGQTVQVTKRVDAQGNATLTTTDGRSGQAVSLYDAQAAEDAARTARYGKLDPALAANVGRASDNKALPVTIWAAQSVVFSPSRTGATPSSALAATEQASAATKQSISDALQRAGVSDVQQAQASPFVFASVNLAQLRQLERRSDVLAVYGDSAYTASQDDSATTERANAIWAAGNLGFGTSSRPAVHEPDAVSDANPFLSNGTHPVIYYCAAVNPICPSGKNIGSGGGHASRVAGAIASTHPLLRGVAPNAQMIISENSQTFANADLVRANEWGRGNGADPTNMSWGETCPSGAQNFMGNYVDFATANLFQTFTISSGNTNGCASNDQMVSEPGSAWTAITVGATFDGNDGFWNNDGIAGFERFINPTFAPGMQKPEVVAVGQDQCLTNDTTTDCGNAGTSFSAPQVAGEVTDMLARRPGQNVWPETNKAAVLASAYHPIGTFDQSTLGEVVMNNADLTYRSGRFINECHNPGCTRLLPADFPGGNRDHPVALTAGQRVKVAIAWDAQSGGGGGSDVLGADIDLSVLSPTNVFICGSFSVQNAWESCEFTAPVTGTYTFREHLFSNIAGWVGTFMGMAWSIKSIPTLCDRPPGLFISPVNGSYAINTANGPTYYDAYAAWPFNQTGREQVFQFRLTAPLNIGVTDTNGNLDLHLVQLTTACSNQPVGLSIKAQGLNSLSFNSAPAGDYFLIADGFNGSVGTDTVNFTFGPPTAPLPQPAPPATRP